MHHSNKHMTLALIASTAFTIFNIIAVTQGTGENYYSKIEQFIVSLLY